MLARLRENLLYKLLALGFALALHFYAVGQENPAQSHTALVPLTVRGVAGNLIFDEKTAPQIAVTLTGPADVLNHLPDTGVTASVDLSKAHAGKSLPLPIRVTLPSGGSALTLADVEPRAVSITLAQKERRSVPITASDPGTPPVGFAFRPARVTPHNAIIGGSQDAVASVQQVVATVDAGGAVGTIDNDFPVVALDAQGAQVGDVTVTPTTAHVLIQMAPIKSGKIVFINYNLIGSVPYPHKVTAIEITPQTVTVTGRPELLSRVSTVQTAPIDLSGVTSDITRQVACTPPPGLAISGSNLVTVTVHIAAPPAPAAPTPAPGAVTPAAPPSQ